MPSQIKVVFFDAGGTLFRPYPSVGDVYARVALKHGVDLEAVSIQQRFHQAWHARQTSGEARPPLRGAAARNGLASLGGVSSDKIERDWWRHLVREVFSESTFKDFDGFFTELYDYFATAECWRLFDDAVPLLDQLKAQGYRLAIISNWDHRLFGIVKDLGLEAYFEQIFASAAVGVAKPGEGIFKKALQTLGVEAQQALHVGDSLEEDFYGAQRVGLKAILLDRYKKAYNGVVHIENLLDLIPHLS